jgi:cytochrome c oxidase subunit 2
MLDTMLKTVSSYGRDIDSLINLIYGVTGFFFVALQGYLVYLLWRYRRRPGAGASDQKGETWKELRWIVALVAVVLALDLGIDARSARIWKLVKEDMPEHPDLTVRVNAQQFQWSFTYPAADGSFDPPAAVTASREMHVPLNKKVLLLLRSKDVIHSFFLPAARLKQDILPGREIPAWLEITEVGPTPLACTQLCGVAHTAMGGSVVAEAQADFDHWLAGQRAATSEEAR